MHALYHPKSDLITAGLCVVFLIATVRAIGPVQRELAFRDLCRQNLANLGRAMLIYANDFDDEFPKAGGRQNDWVQEIPNWQAESRNEAYGNDSVFVTGKTTVSASLYLLVKYEEVKPSQFICRSDILATEFKLSDIQGTATDTTLTEVWDFGPWTDVYNNPSRHCSYAYHWPFGQYALTGSSDLRMAIAADRNPWIDPNRVADREFGWDLFIPDDPAGAWLGNSENHQREGQNVLFLDSHVAFSARATCGFNDDNVYSIASENTPAGREKGIPPEVYSTVPPPLNRLDSVLVQEYPSSK